MKKLITVCTWLAALAVSGCAQLSPQQVTFSPSIPAESIPSGDGATVTLAVEDRRGSNEIGQRGGVYEESSSITPKNDLQSVLASIGEKVLDRAGYQQVELDPEVELVVALEELSYELADVDAARKEATAAAEISVQAVRDNKVYNNSFRALRRIETLRYPSEEENSELLNHVFNGVLKRAFADPGLEAFLNE